jgi:hypothetical protein
MGRNDVDQENVGKIEIRKRILVTRHTRLKIQIVETHGPFGAGDFDLQATPISTSSVANQ